MISHTNLKMVVQTKRRAYGILAHPFEERQFRKCTFKLIRPFTELIVPTPLIHSSSSTHVVATPTDEIQLLPMADNQLKTKRLFSPNCTPSTDTEEIFDKTNDESIEHYDDYLHDLQQVVHIDRSALIMQKTPLETLQKNLHNPNVINSDEIFSFVSKMRVNDPVLIDVSKKASFTEAFIICDVNSSKALRHIALTIKKEFSGRIIDESKSKVGADHRLFPEISGLDSTDWIAIDFGKTILHLFHTEWRKYYDLEGLWCTVDSDADSLAQI